MGDLFKSFIEFKRELGKHALDNDFSKTTYINHYGRSCFYSQTEPFERFMIKSILSNELFRQGKSVITDWEVRQNNRLVKTVDVIDTSDMVVYDLGKVHQNIRFKTVQISPKEISPEARKGLLELQELIKSKISR